MPPRRNERGRSPGPGSGPDAQRVLITQSIVTIPGHPARDPGAYSVDQLPDRIASNVTIDPETGEWIWSGRLDRDGYGRIGSHLAHRVVYTIAAAPIPAGLELDHVKAWGCTNRACVSPWHLEPVTSRQNTMRGSSFAAVNAAKNRCDHGHEFDLLNTYWRPDGHRDCRKCTARRQREYQTRLRQQAAASLPLFGLGRAA